MSIVQVLGAFLAGVTAIAALSLIVAPSSQAANVVTSFGNASTGLIKAAKGS